MTSTHIAAIQISTYHAHPSVFLEYINDQNIADDAVVLIRQARAYWKYYNNLSTEQ